MLWKSISQWIYIAQRHSVSNALSEEVALVFFTLFLFRNCSIEFVVQFWSHFTLDLILLSQNLPLPIESERLTAHLLEVLVGYQKGQMACRSSNLTNIWVFVGKPWSTSVAYIEHRKCPVKWILWVLNCIKLSWISLLFWKVCLRSALQWGASSRTGGSSVFVQTRCGQQKSPRFNREADFHHKPTVVLVRGMMSVPLLAGCSCHPLMVYKLRM